MDGRMFLVATPGPTSFIVQEGTEEDAKKYKVLIGPRMGCSCGYAEKEVCEHVLFVMVKVLRVPEENPLSWQLSLLDAELETVLAFRGQAQCRNQV